MRKLPPCHRPPAPGATQGFVTEPIEALGRSLTKPQDSGLVLFAQPVQDPMQVQYLRLLLLALCACSPSEEQDSAPAAPQPPSAPVREAQQILEDVARARLAVQPFDENRRANATYFQEYREQNLPAWNRICELALELRRTHPEDAGVIVLMRERWQLQCTEMGQWEAAVREMEVLMADEKSAPALIDEARHSRALACLGQLQVDSEHPDPERLVQAQAAVDAMLAAKPDDARCQELLWQLGLLYDGDPVREHETFARLVELYPTVARSNLYRGKLRQLDGVGQIFDMPPFQSAIDEREVDLAALHGKVLVVVFWAARAQPAVNRLAEFQRLAREHAAAGVEFIGVSLDDSADKGGRELLVKTAAEHGLDWPQNHLGAGWVSPFSVSWGITRLPQVFVVDREGRLSSTAAQRDLEGAIRVAMQLPAAAGKR